MQRKRWGRLGYLAIPLVVAWAQGCVGVLGGDAAEQGPKVGDASQGCAEGPAAVVVPLRRLTTERYLNSVRDLLGDPDFEADLDEPSGDVITERAVRQLRDAAELALTRRSEWTREVFPCDTDGEGSDECVETFIDSFGLRAFRRPLTDRDRSWLRGVYDDARVEASFEEALGVVFQVMLQSPSMVYMVERGTGGGTVRPLTDYEIASRLSYFLWSTMPDDGLLEAASVGELSDPSDLRAHA